LVTTRDVSEKESVLDDGTVQKRLCTVIKQFRCTVADEVTAAEQDLNSDRELLSIDVDERVTHIPSDICDINDPNITSDERVEYIEEVTDEGVPCRKKATITEYFLSKMTEKDVPHDVVVIQPESAEHLDIESSLLRPDLLSQDSSFNVTDLADNTEVNSENVVHDMELTSKVSVTNKPPTVTVSQGVRRVGSDGRIEEQYGSGDDALICEYDATDNILTYDDSVLSDVMCYHFLSAADGEDVPTDELPAGLGVQVYTKTVEDEPIVEQSVTEYDDVEEDGTVVHRRVTKTTQKKTIVQQVFIKGDEGTVDDVTGSGPTVREYTDIVAGPGDMKSNVEETEEILDDGSIVRRKVMMTSHQQLVTERHMVAGKPADTPEPGQLRHEGDSDTSLAPVNGKQSPQSYIPELMKLSGTESDSTKEPGEYKCFVLVGPSLADWGIFGGGYISVFVSLWVTGIS